MPCLEKVDATVILDYLEARKLPSLFKRHIHYCAACQNVVLEYSHSHFIPDSLFDRPFEKQKLLWFGAEFANFTAESDKGKKSSNKRNSKNSFQDLPEIEEEAISGRFSKFLAFCLNHKKLILFTGYLALLVPLVRFAFAFL